MKNILIAGAGKSSSSLIDYMLKHSKNQWTVTLMDACSEAVMSKLNNHPNGIPAIIDITNDKERNQLVAKSDIVISVMPPHLHYLLAKDCLQHSKHLITSSYLSDDIKALDEQVKAKDLLFMCEMGCDPGIDHMSTSQIFSGIKKIAGDIVSFKSFCGGLIAPESDNNPWNYKITWNPNNVVTAAQSGAVWKEDNKTIHLDNSLDVFTASKKLKVNGLSTLSYYPNRDALKYLELYDIPQVKTFVRATLRYPNYMKAWKYVIEMGLTTEKDSFNCIGKTYAEWISEITQLPLENLKEAVEAKYQIDSKSMAMIEWLGIFSDVFIGFDKTESSARILQKVIEEKWAMQYNDKDMIVMQHVVEYERKAEKFKMTSSMVYKGENKIQSAMAKTVGLPMAILAHKILQGLIVPKKISGVRIPTMPEVYQPVLRELAKFGIEFHEEIA